MATLVWQPNCSSSLVLFRNGVIRENAEHYIKVDTPVQRDGYMRKVNSAMIHFHSQSEMKSIRDYHTTPDDMYAFFHIDNMLYQKQYIENVDPWLCFTEDCSLVMYFGKDKPVRKQKTVKSLTKHRRMWEHTNMWFKDTDKPHTYNYWSVKEPSLMLICSCSLHYMEQLFPELTYKLQYYVDRQELILNEPFKCSDEYDYSEEEKAEIIKKENEKKEAERKRLEEIERRKELPGYCDICGCEHADYVQDPYQYEMNGYIVHRWLCRHCYSDLLGDI